MKTTPNYRVLFVDAATHPDVARAFAVAYEDAIYGKTLGYCASREQAKAMAYDAAYEVLRPAQAAWLRRYGLPSETTQT